MWTTQGPSVHGVLTGVEERAAWRQRLEGCGHEEPLAPPEAARGREAPPLGPLV